MAAKIHQQLQNVSGKLFLNYFLSVTISKLIRKPYHFCSSCCRNGQQPDLLQLPNDDDEGTSPFVLCTQHMCPIRVHWHLKVSYKEYWRVKVTITNFNILKNYTDWNLVIQHPNLQSITQVFSFNYNPLIQYGDISKCSLLVA